MLDSSVIVSPQPVHRFVALLAVVALAAALPMVLCSQVPTCTMELAMDSCDMASGSECCEPDASPAPSAVGAALASLQAPLSATPSLGPDLSSPMEQAAVGAVPDDLGPPVAIYTLLAILLI